MEPHEQIDQTALKEERKGKFVSAGVLLNIGLVGLLTVVGYLSYGYMTRESSAAAADEGSSSAPKVVQLDVLNGSRIRGAAARVTSTLRLVGFDVVEMKNYKTNNVHQTVVVDRVGNLSSARRVAHALGVSEKNIVQQLNPDYFVDVSVIVGEDVASLKLAP